nr:MAG TPA: hypothetical protein [Caudoviricetes sp.]
MCIDLLGQGQGKSSGQDMLKPLLRLKNSIKVFLWMKV